MTALRSAARRDAVRFLDSNASLLVLLLANFFLLALVQDACWGALGSVLLSALALLVAISDRVGAPNQQAPSRSSHARSRSGCAEARPLTTTPSVTH